MHAHTSSNKPYQSVTCNLTECALQHQPAACLTINTCMQLHTTLQLHTMLQCTALPWHAMAYVAAHQLPNLEL